MRKTTQNLPAASKHKAYVPLEPSQRKDEAKRLFEECLNTFASAPEANFLLKRYFFDDFYEKAYLQDNIFFCPACRFSLVF